MYTLYSGVALLVFVGRGGLLRCCVVFGLLAWHSVMETTMVETVRRGALTPWHQTWHRAHPGFSAAQLGFPVNPPFYSLTRLLRLPHSSFSFCLHFSRFLLLSVSPTFCAHTQTSCLLLPLVSPLNFILSYATQRQPFTHGT